MKKHSMTVALFATLFAALLLTTNTISSQTVGETVKEPPLSSNIAGTINIDGDVSLTEAQNRIYWNPHSTGFTTATAWNVTFNNKTKISLKTTATEAGHVATGAWWTTSFKSGKKIPLHTSKPKKLMVNLRVNVATIHYELGDEWLRIALASAVQRSDGSVVYTEMDFWDSPNTLRHPSGNIKFGGNVVYRGGDVVEYKIDQAIISEWTNYSLDLTRFIDRAWSLKPGDMLESVYVVVETMGVPVEVTVEVDDLWITWVG